MRNAYKILVGNLKIRDCLEDIGVDGRKIEWILRGLGWEYMDWIHMPQDRDQWRTLVNTAMNLQVPY
jgi:hypothetical protein